MTPSAIGTPDAGISTSAYDDASNLIETVDEAGPFGAKGLGESGVIPVAAAVANAVKDAVGVRLTELPMTPERVFRALAARSRAPGAPS